MTVVATGTQKAYVVGEDWGPAVSKTVIKLDKAIDKVSTERATLGATQNRLEHTMNSIMNSHENLSAAESRIRDVDMAKEMANFSKQQVLLQAGMSITAQANQKTSMVTQLLR